MKSMTYLKPPPIFAKKSVFLSTRKIRTERNAQNSAFLSAGKIRTERNAQKSAFLNAGKMRTKRNAQKSAFLVSFLGASSKVEKEKKHYQGLPEDVGPDSGKSWSQRSRKMKRDKTGRSRKRKKSEVEMTAYQFMLDENERGK